METSSITTPEVESEEELDGLEASVPYTLVYTSSIADEPVEFEGELAMTYEDPGGWTVAWTEADMWPGIEGAAGFAVDVKEPKRGAILDRNGKVIAKGDRGEAPLSVRFGRWKHCGPHRAGEQAGGGRRAGAG